MGDDDDTLSAAPSYPDSKASDDERRVAFYRNINFSTSQLQRLPCPVILPQRRPRDRTRGFVRAYAPVMLNAGIDQETWLRVMDDFHESSKVTQSANLQPIFISMLNLMKRQALSS
jgi:hypothetical protein